MKNQKSVTIALCVLVIVLIISLIFVSYKNREQRLYIERTMLAEELNERLHDLTKLRIMLEEIPFNSETMNMIARINDHRGVDFIQEVQYTKFPFYYKFLLDYDVEYYGFIHDLKDRAAVMGQSNLNDIIKELKSIEATLLGSIKWEIGKDDGKHYIKLEFEQKDMNHVIDGLRDIRSKIDGFRQ